VLPRQGLALRSAGGRHGLNFSADYFFQILQYWRTGYVYTSATLFHQ